MKEKEIVRIDIQLKEKNWRLILILEGWGWMERGIIWEEGSFTLVMLTFTSKSGW